MCLWKLRWDFLLCQARFGRERALIQEALYSVQVLSGILPISRVSAIPLCIYHAARLLPLEKVLGLAHPSLSSPPPEDKRTWREGMRPSASAGASEPPQKELVWTAMDILTAYANKKGWVTAKAGRPDVNRAGNAST